MIAGYQLNIVTFQSTPSGGKATTWFLQRRRRDSRFQSTPSGGKATVHVLRSAAARTVSIHAFRGEGDQRTGSMLSPDVRFNPRLPGGRRRLVGVWFVCRKPMFQSTPSGGKATLIPLGQRPVPDVSIHAFRGEGDRDASRLCYNDRSFNPRLPGGRRHALPSPALAAAVAFQSTPSGGKATAHQDGVSLSTWCFNPRLPGGRRRLLRCTRYPTVGFQSTPSGGKATSSRDHERFSWLVSIHAFRGEGDRNI